MIMIIIKMIIVIIMIIIIKMVSMIIIIMITKGKQRSFYLYMLPLYFYALSPLLKISPSINRFS